MMTDLTAKALRLREMQARVLETLLHSLEKAEGGTASEEERKNLGSTLEGYIALIKEIKTVLLEEDVPVITDLDAREIVQKMTLGAQLPLEEALEEFSKRDPALRQFLRGELDFEDDWEEIEKLAIDHFYSWFSGIDYVTALYETGVLVVGFPDIPPHLKEYVAEARRCYALQQHLAVTGLCRAILEISLNDLHHAREIEKGLDPQTPRVETAERRIRDLINDADIIPPNSELKKRCHRLVDRVIPAIHPSSHQDNQVGETRARAEEILRETLSIVSELYLRCNNK